MSAASIYIDRDIPNNWCTHKIEDDYDFLLPRLTSTEAETQTKFS